MQLTAIVTALVEAGASPEMILAAVKAGEASQREKDEARHALEAVAAEERKRKARERKARYRSAMSRDVPRDTMGRTGTDGDTPLPERPSTPLLATVEVSLNPPPYSPPFGETLSASGDADPVSGKSGKPKARKSYPEQFEAFWKAFPVDRNMSKAEALAAWQRISPDERNLALAACDPYRRWLAEKPDRPVIHACRFLSKRRFEGHAAPAGDRSTGPPVEAVPDFETVEERNDWVAERSKEIMRRINGDDSGGVRKEDGENRLRVAGQP